MAPSAERPRGRSLRPLRALLPFLRPHAGVLAAALAALLIASGAMLVLPLRARQLIDHGMSAGDAAIVNRYFAGFLLVAVVFGVFAALRYYLVTWLGERVVADLRTAVYRRVVRMDPTFFEVTRTGEVLSRLTADTTLVQSIAGANLSFTLRSIVNLCGGRVVLGRTPAPRVGRAPPRPRLMGVIVVLIPLVVAPLVIVGRRVRGLSRAAQDRVADTSSLVDETLNAIQTVQAFTLEELQGERYRSAVEDSFAAANRRNRTRAVLTAAGTMLVFAGITGVLWLGFRAVLAHQMSSGQLLQFLVYAVMVGASAAALTEMWGEVQRAAGAMERLAELLVAEPAIAAPAAPATLGAHVDGRVGFEGVRFGYPSRPGSAALDGITLEIRPGQTVALVGPSGAGKSTMFQLLLRFYDPAAGRVCIDGVDLRALRPEELRARIGLVPQETVLFGTSARENIRYGRPAAGDAEIEAAARAAAADEFIRALPEGYDTFLGERGTRLSGGQRQRIAIARAILKNPPILLLDEATSSLDAESERLVQEALDPLMRGRTTLVIAHRLATVLKADRIVVLDRGRIVAAGTHAELLASNPLYQRLAALQFSAGA